MAPSATGEFVVNQRAISILNSTWKIENFDIHTKIETGGYIISPDFKIMFDEGTIYLFNLKLYPNGNREINKNFLTLKLLVSGSNYKSLPLNMIRISLLNEKCNTIRSEVLENKNFRNNHIVLPQFYPKNQALIHGGTLLIQISVSCSTNLDHHGTDTIYNVNPVNNLMKKYQSRAYEDYEQLLDDEKFSDVKVMIGDKTIHSHRVILTSRSQVFKAMLEHPMKENQNGKIQITDIKYEVMKELLRFLYASKVNEIEKIAADLLVAADKYSIDDLKDLCEKSLYGTLNCDNAIEYLILTSSCNTVQLKSQVIQFINDHPNIVNQPEFKTVDSDIMYEVVRAIANKRMKY